MKRPSWRPSPGSLIAVLALVVAISGGAIAKDKIDDDEVTNTTVIGSLASTSDPPQEPPETEGPPGDPIPLSAETFTQKAGEALVISAYADISGVPQPEATCDLFVSVHGGSSEDVDWNFMLETFQLARRGDGGDAIDEDVFPAPPADRTLSFVAVAQEVDIEGDFEEGGDCSDDSFSVDLRMTFTTLRD